MNRPDISELHFISPIENLTSILEYGILSNRRAAQLDHRSVAMEEVRVPRERGDEPVLQMPRLLNNVCSPRARVKKTVAGTVCFRENLVECGVLELAASRARCLLA